LVPLDVLDNSAGVVSISGFALVCAFVVLSNFLVRTRADKSYFCEVELFIEWENAARVVLCFSALYSMALADQNTYFYGILL